MATFDVGILQLSVALLCQIGNILFVPRSPRSDSINGIAPDSQDLRFGLGD